MNPLQHSPPLPMHRACPMDLGFAPILARLPLLLALLLHSDVLAQAPGRRPRGQGEFRPPMPAFQTDVPAHDADVVLARPTDRSVVLSLRVATAGNVVVEHRPQGHPNWTRAESRGVEPWTPREIPLEGLASNVRHEYRVTLAAPGVEPRVVAEGGFHTARPRGSPFAFTVQADSHLDFGILTERYARSLSNAVASRPDFHVDLGDTFMTDKHAWHEDAAPMYQAQRYWLGIVGRHAPVFLVLGNHDGESPGRGVDGDAMREWSHGWRTRHFPNPIPDAFYSGNTQRHPRMGWPQDYYAWTWGDALFVALDPFWYSQRTGRGPSDGWARTLGRDQYEWLRGLLATNASAHVFVFIHHLVGGLGKDARGGAEASLWLEWGGDDPAGGPGFAERRKGWEAPIHELLRRRRRVVVFHGHDHFFARQERDGVIYQMVPQPGHRRGATQSARDYGYESGALLPGSGILRVRVEPASFHLDFVGVDGDVLRTEQVLPAR